MEIVEIWYFQIWVNFGGMAVKNLFTTVFAYYKDHPPPSPNLILNWCGWLIKRLVQTLT